MSEISINILSYRDMKKNTLLVWIILLLGSIGCFAQENREKKIPVNINFRAGVGAVSSDIIGYDGYGAGANIAGYVELPLSKRYSGWNVNLGLKLNYKNLSNQREYSIGINDRQANIYWTQEANMLFLDVPVIFSYDFTVNERSTFRLGFGAFYSRYVTGCTKVLETGESYPANLTVGGVPISDPSASNPLESTRPYYVVDSFVPFINNAGLIFGVGFYVNDFYIGAEYEMLYNGETQPDFRTTFTATAGYRF